MFRGNSLKISIIREELVVTILKIISTIFPNTIVMRPMTIDIPTWRQNLLTLSLLSYTNLVNINISMWTIFSLKSFIINQPPTERLHQRKIKIASIQHPKTSIYHVRPLFPTVNMESTILCDTKNMKTQIITICWIVTVSKENIILDIFLSFCDNFLNGKSEIIGL